MSDLLTESQIFNNVARMSWDLGDAELFLLKKARCRENLGIVKINQETSSVRSKLHLNIRGQHDTVVSMHESAVLQNVFKKSTQFGLTMDVHLIARR